MRKIWLIILIWFLFGSVTIAWAIDYPQSHGKQFDFRARVKADGKLVDLPSPLYMTDFYPGAWTDLENKNVDDVFWYKPNKITGEYFIGDYGQTNFGKREVIKQRLKVVKDLGMYPAINIMNKHIIKKNAAGGYYLADWPAYGVKINGEYVGDWRIYKEVYLPILKELKLPHTVILDMWGFLEWVPDDIPKSEYRRLFWEEFEQMYMGTVADPEGNDYRIWAKRYIDAPDAWVPMAAIYLNLNKHTQQTACDSTAVIEGFFRAAGGPEGTGINPINGHWLNLHGNFWLSWELFTPPFRKCLNKNQGLWNVANISQSGSITEADHASNIAESYDSVGPRFFYGFVHRLHDNKTSATSRDTVLSDNDWGVFLGDRAVKKGLMWTSVWNEYAESIVMEPANLTEGSVLDRINPWVNNKPYFIEKLKIYKKSQVLPAELTVTDVCGQASGTVSELVNWYVAYKNNQYLGSVDYNCDSKIDIGDLVRWYGVYRK